VAALKRGSPHGIQVLSDGSEVKIRDACMTRVVHKDVRLAERQHGSETRFKTVTYYFETPVNRIAGVEVTEALGNIGYLVTNVSVG